MFLRGVVLGPQVSHLHFLTEGLAFATEVVPKLYSRSYKKKMTLHVMPILVAKWSLLNSVFVFALSTFMEFPYISTAEHGRTVSGL